METKNKIIRFVCLLPHKDAVSIVQKESALILKTGAPGIYPFPAAALLAETSSPLRYERLKENAKTLRKTIEGQISGKFEAGALCSLPLDDFRLPLPFFFIAGRLLSCFEPPFSHAELESGALCALSKIVLPLLLVKDGVKAGAAGTPDARLKDFFSAYRPPIKFRAAALANIAFRFSAHSLEWKIGRPAWLPRQAAFH